MSEVLNLYLATYAMMPVQRIADETSWLLAAMALPADDPAPALLARLDTLPKLSA